MRIAHIIGGLGVGGAERMLQRLVAQHSKQPDISIIVISMTSIGAPGKDMQAQGIRVEALNMKGLFSAVSGFAKMLCLLWKFKPDIVQTWLYWADLAGGLAAKLCRVKAVIWNIRCTHFGDGRWTGHVVRINAHLSHWLPTSIICCGYTAMNFHRDQGFNSDKMVVLPNGYDVQHFNAVKNVRRLPETRSKLQIVALGRMDVLKDYPTFIAAAKIALSDNKDLHFSIFGRGCVNHYSTIKQIAELGIGSNFSLHEEVSDVRTALSKADIFVSSSVSEGFPNVVAEAMAMQVPCVVTDAGDAAIIVGNTGQVVPVSNAEALAEAIRRLARLPQAERDALGLLARKRIVENYEIAYVAQLYSGHYEATLQRVANAR